jgi:hypothetical protein
MTLRAIHPLGAATPGDFPSSPPGEARRAQAGSAP